VYLISFHQKQFRAAWRRVCGKDNVNPTINETTVNQLSDSSSKAYIECSFIGSERKKKNRSKQKPISKADLLELNNKKLKNINETYCNNNNIIMSKNNEIIKSQTVVSNELHFSEQKKFIFANEINRNQQNNYEMRLFSSEINIYGKTINQIIRANSYKSNIC
jgi:hypothetical protein